METNELQKENVFENMMAEILDHAAKELAAFRRVKTSIAERVNYLLWPWPVRVREGWVH